MDNILEPLHNISINSDITFVQKTNHSQYELFEIFSRGRHLGQPVIKNSIGTYNEMYIKPLNISFKSGKEKRLNLTGIILRGCTVIDRPNIDPSNENLDKLLTPTDFNFGISNISKYHYALNKLLLFLYGFQVKYRVVRGWTGRFPSGERKGILGVAQRGEADIIASAALQRIERHDDLDNLHMSYKFEPKFIYRITPKVAQYSADYNALLTPFSKWVWYLTSVTGLFFAILFMIFERSDGHISNAILHMIATICQQGIDFITTRPVTKILLFSLTVTTFIMYNYYTSTIVGSLLTVTPKGPSTLDELIDSPLYLSFEDISYHKALFTNPSIPILKKIYEKKLKDSRNPNQLPVFTTVTKAVDFIRHGEYAYHSETNLIYPELIKQFNDQEMCELKVIRGVWLKTELMMFAPKRHQYNEMFKIGLLKSSEYGLVNREQKIYVNVDKPKCTATSLFAVSLNGVYTAFFILFSGFLLGLVILLVEICCKKHAKQIKKISIKGRNMLKK